MNVRKCGGGEGGMHHTGGSGRRMQARPIKDDDMAPRPSNFMAKFERLVGVPR